MTSSVNVMNTSHVLHISKVNANINQENSFNKTDAQSKKFWESASVTETSLKKNLSEYYPDVKFYGQRYEVALP